MIANIIPISEKYLITIEEASVYSSIGINAIRAMLKTTGDTFTIYIGQRRLIVREKFEAYLCEQKDQTKLSKNS